MVFTESHFTYPAAWKWNSNRLLPRVTQSSLKCRSGALVTLPEYAINPRIRLCLLLTGELYRLIVTVAPSHVFLQRHTCVRKCTWVHETLRTPLLPKQMQIKRGWLMEAGMMPEPRNSCQRTQIEAIKKETWWTKVWPALWSHWGSKHSSSPPVAWEALTVIQELRRAMVTLSHQKKCQVMKASRYITGFKEIATKMTNILGS